MSWAKPSIMKTLAKKAAMPAMIAASNPRSTPRTNVAAPDSRLRWSWDQGIGLIYLLRGQDQKAIDQLSRAALEALMRDTL